MPATTTEFLTRFFVEDLPFTPTARQIDVFRSDLGLVSPYLMAGALKEVRAGIVGSILVYQPNDWRPLIFQIYNRKVAEHAQLYPIFHTFETAFRSTVAVALEDHYRTIGFADYLLHRTTDSLLPTVACTSPLAANSQYIAANAISCSSAPRRT